MLGLPKWCSGKESACWCRNGFDPWVGKISWRRKATHSSVLARRIPWIEEPGGLQSRGGIPKSWTWLSMHTYKPTLKFIWNLKGLKTILTKKNKLEDSNLFDFKTYCKGTVIKTVYGTGIRQTMTNGTDSPGITPPQDHWVGKKQSCQQPALGKRISTHRRKKLDSYVSPYTKINSKWLKCPKCKEPELSSF